MPNSFRCKSVTKDRNPTAYPTVALFFLVTDGDGPRYTRKVPSLSISGFPPLVRTDFADDRAWERLCADVARGYSAVEAPGLSVEFINDPAFGDLEALDVLGSIVGQAEGTDILFIADREAMNSLDYPILVVSILPVEGEQYFRCAAQSICEVQTNLDLSNLDWADFAGATDQGGVFRGF